MPWGTGEWGITPWGLVGELSSSPTILSVQTPHGDRAGSGVVARRGGDVIRIIGSNFGDPMTIEVLNGMTVVGTCYIFRPEYDIQPDRVWCGTPALPDGTYDLRVTTTVATATLASALTYELFAEEMKTLTVRSNVSARWKTGRRMLSTGEPLV